jgi:predicted metalloprotease with PDZ domain
MDRHDITPEKAQNANNAVEGIAMPRINRLSAWLSGLMVIVFVIAVAASQAKSAEPSSAMLGVVPIDVEGQVFVKDVYVGSPAQAAGLQTGDRILEAGDKAVIDAADLIALIREYQPNTRIELHASRGGWVKRLSITLAERGDVERQPLASAAQRQPQSQGATVRSRGLTAQEERRIHEERYFHSKKRSW